MKNAQSEARDVREHVAAEVRAELARRQMSLTEAADRLGWTLSTTHRRLTGKASLDVGHLDEIASMLGVPIQRFFPPRRRSPDRGGIIGL